MEAISHNNIDPDGMTSLAGGLFHLTELDILDISHNNIDLEGAKTIITSLKGCHELSTAFINREDEYYTRDGITVHGLLSPDNTTAIQARTQDFEKGGSEYRVAVRPRRGGGCGKLLYYG